MHIKAKDELRETAKHSDPQQKVSLLRRKSFPLTAQQHCGQGKAISGRDVWCEDIGAF